jgi:hypothetical protein
MDEKEVYELHRALVVTFLELAKVSEPRDYQVFLGSFMANVVGNLPADYWEKMSKTDPCGIAGCDCHVHAKKVMGILQILRTDQRQFILQRKASG